MINSVLKASGLLQVELAEIFGVSRVTMNSWIVGRFKPHALHRDWIERRVEAVRAAISANELPLPADIDRHRRVPEAKSILDKYM